MLYDYLDSTPFYRCPVQPGSRSVMNVVFTLPTPELLAEFLEEVGRARMVGLAGYRSVGGCRASLFNGVTREAVERLVDFMRGFEHQHQIIPSPAVSA